MRVEYVTRWRRERPSLIRLRNMVEAVGTGRRIVLGGHLCESLELSGVVLRKHNLDGGSFSWGSLGVVDKRGTTAA
jgi:hypothetical protein